MGHARNCITSGAPKASRVHNKQTTVENETSQGHEFTTSTPSSKHATTRHDLTTPSCQGILGGRLRQQRCLQKPVAYPSAKKAKAERPPKTTSVNCNLSDHKRVTQEVASQAEHPSRRPSAQRPSLQQTHNDRKRSITRARIHNVNTCTRTCNSRA